VVLRPGIWGDQLPDYYVTERPDLKAMMGFESMIWTFPLSQARNHENIDSFGLGCLASGTYTATVMTYSEAAAEVRQESQVFAVGDDEIVNLDFAL